jgi:hypothetical protein
VTGLQILAYARRSGPLSMVESLSCHTYCDTGPRFKRSHPKDRHVHPTVGFEPPTQGSSDHCAPRSNHCATQATISLLKFDVMYCRTAIFTYSNFSLLLRMQYFHILEMCKFYILLAQVKIIFNVMQSDKKITIFYCFSFSMLDIL